MRSVMILLRDASEPEVADFLTITYPYQKPPPWIADINGDACLYINIDKRIDPVDLIGHGPIGFTPSLVVAADISGRHIGMNEVKFFVESTLQRFDGVVLEDNSSRPWTLEEIRAGAIIDGEHFSWF